MSTTPLFTDLNLSQPLQLAIQKSGYTTPTPIQQQAIPPVLEGKDLLGCAQTGTGKTAAFALPILHNLAAQDLRAPHKSALVLVLTPTRELALQIYESFKTYGENLNIRTAVAYGGVGIKPQIQALHKGAEILIATPGRLLDLIDQRYLTLQHIKVLVLDEADRMLDMGFIADIRQVLKMVPVKRQTLFFSATMPAEIAHLASSMLKSPVRVEVTPVSSTAEKVEQSLIYVDRARKKDLLRHVLLDSSLKRVIVFTRTKHTANRLAELLEKNKVSSAAIHGNKSQGARQKALDMFKAGKVRVLIATDLAARGIDVDGITHVINYEIPNVSESYVHRIGRTARAGMGGAAISFCDVEERSFIRDIEKVIGQKIPVQFDHPFHSKEVELAHVVSSGKAKARMENNGPRMKQKLFGRGRFNKSKPRTVGGGSKGDGPSASGKPKFKTSWP